MFHNFLLKIKISCVKNQPHGVTCEWHGLLLASDQCVNYFSPAELWDVLLSWRWIIENLWLLSSFLNSTIPSIKYYISGQKLTFLFGFFFMIICNNTAPITTHTCILYILFCWGPNHFSWSQYLFGKEHVTSEDVTSLIVYVFLITVNLLLVK